MKKALQNGNALLTFWLPLCFFVSLQGSLQAQKVYEIYNSNNGTWPFDYIILSGFSSNQSVVGLSLQYRGNTSSAWQSINLIGTADASGFYRVWSAPDASGAPWTPQLVWTTGPNMPNGGTAGTCFQVALMNTTNTIVGTGTCPVSNILDVVAVRGTNSGAANAVSGCCGAGNSESPSSNTQSHRRVSDTGDDETDFVLIDNPYTTPSCSAGTISGTTTICQGATTQLSSNGDAGGTWSSSNTSIPVNAAGLVTGAVGGVTVISYTVTNGACTNTATAAVTVNARPNAAIAMVENVVSGSFGVAYYNVSLTDGILCTGPLVPSPSTNATLTASGGGNYLWSNGSTNNSITVSTANTYSVVVTNAAGCQSTVTQTISVNAAPNAGTISATPSVFNFGGLGLCNNATITLSSTVPGGTWEAVNKFPSPQVVSIDPVTGLTMPLVSTFNTDSHSVFYRVTANGCISSSRVGIEVLEAPNAGTISGTTSVCAGLTTQLSSNGTTAINTIRTWSSDNMGVATVDANTGLVTGVASGTATITYTVTDFAGTTTSPILRCTSTTSTMVTVGAGSNAGTINGTTTVCAGVTSQLTSTGDPGGTWSSSNMAVATVSSSGLFTGVLGNSGTSTITYTVTAGNCTSSASVLVTVNASPNAGTISGNTNICSSPFLGNNTTQLSIIGGAGGGTWASSNTNVATVNGSGLVSSVPPSTNSGTSIISYTVTNGSCSNTATILITLNANPSALVTSTPFNTCINTDVTISVPDAGTGANYAWGGDITNTNSNTIVSNTSIPGFKSYSVTVTAANGCSNTGFGSHIVNQPINTTITATPNPVCFGVTLSLSIPQAASTTASWTGPGINNTNGFSTTASPTTTGLQTYTVTATTTPYLGSCVYTGTIDVMVETTQPTCNVSGPTLVCPGSTSSFNAPNGLSGYSWGVTGDGSIVGASNGASVSVTAVTSGTYTVNLTVTSASGCTNTCSQIVTVNTVPSCISNSAPPNGQLGVPVAASALSWGSVPNVTHYLVYFGSNAPNYDNIFNGYDNGASTNRPYSALAPNTTYGYRIVPVNDCGEAVGCPTITFSTCTPAFTCPANRNVNLSGTCTMTIPDLITGLTANQGCGSLNFTQSPTAGTVVPSSHNATVLVTIMPDNPAVSTCQVTLTGKDVTPPNLICPGNQFLNVGANCIGLMPNYAGSLSFPDNCSSTSNTQTPAAGTPQALGTTTTLTLTASDLAGNTVSCAFSVMTRDVTAPSITCPPNATVSANASCQGTVGTYTAATLSDNCNPSPMVAQSPASTTTLTGHNTAQTVTLTANDGNGNTATCAMTVTLKDVTPPSITCPPNATVSANASCQGTVGTYTAATLSDNCNPSPTVMQSPASTTILTGHNTAQTVTLTANDGNGNTATCAVTVTLKDVTPPTITCPGPQTLPITNSLLCTAVLGSASATFGDNCGAALTYQSSGATTASGNGQISGLTVNSGTTNITYTATDQAGLTSACSFAVTVAPCINGKIIWEINRTSGVKDVTIAVTGDQNLTVLTPLSGEYSIALSGGSNFTITPSKNLNKLNGVNALDVQRIQQHLNGGLLTNPYQLVAADVNSNNTISALDANIIQLAMLGNTSALAQMVKSWRFVPVSHTLSNPPWGFPEQIVLSGTNGNQSNLNFYGMKVGDVVATYANPANTGQDNPFVLRTLDQTLEAGTAIAVEFRADPLSDLVALQFALRFDPKALQLAKTESLGGLPLTADNFGAYEVENGSLRLVWATDKSLALKQTTDVIRLTFNVLETGGRLSDLLQLDPETLAGHVYNSLSMESDVLLRFDASTAVGNPQAEAQVQLFQNRPNPFVSNTSIGFVLPEACEARLRILDAAGRVVAERNKQYPAGRHEEIFGLSATPGILYYELTTPSGVLTKKMVKAE